MSEELKSWELPEDYKFVDIIKCCEPKIDFDANTIVDKILSTRAKKVDKEVIRLLKSIGEEKGINELILIDESKVLKMIKSLKVLDIIENELQLRVISQLEGNKIKRYIQYLPCFAKEIDFETFELLKEILK